MNKTEMKRKQDSSEYITIENKIRRKEVLHFMEVIFYKRVKQKIRGVFFHEKTLNPSRGTLKYPKK